MMRILNSKTIVTSLLLSQIHFIQANEGVADAKADVVAAADGAATKVEEVEAPKVQSHGDDITGGSLPSGIEHVNTKIQAMVNKDAVVDDADFQKWKDELTPDKYEALYEKYTKNERTLVYENDDKKYQGTSYDPTTYEIKGHDEDLNAQITVNPNVEGQQQQGNVKVDLVDGDQLTVSSLERGFTLVTFTKIDGTELKLWVQDSDSDAIALDFKNHLGQRFLHISDSDFVVPNLKTGFSGELVVDPEYVTPSREAYANGDYSSSWATYMKKDENKGLGTLSIPSLRLNLNLNKIHGDFIKKTEVKTDYVHKDGKCKSVDETVEALKQLVAESRSQSQSKKDDWNYAQHGADWIKDYPSCGDHKQSPINFIDPVNDYGQAYDIYDFADDNLQKTYWDLGTAAIPALIGWDWNSKTIDGVIDPVYGKSFFESDLGVNIFKAPKQWNGLSFEYHSSSEHTINDKRFNLEMQMFHTVPLAKTAASEAAEAAAAEATASSQRRVLQEVDELVEGLVNLKDQEVFQKAGVLKGSYTNAQVNEGGFRLAGVGMLFDVKEFDEGLDPEKKQVVEDFFDEVIAVNDPTNTEAYRLSLEKLMNVIDWGNRYVYKGSLTTPPCKKYVFWNVIRRVYPISQRHYDFFKNKQRTINPVNAETYREIQTGFNADVIYVRSAAQKIVASVLGLVALVSAWTQ